MRLNVYLPDALGERIKRELADVNVSQVLRDALAQLLDCDHPGAVCVDCGQEVDMGGDLGEFYAAILAALEPLVDQHGTAEGAARLMKQVALDLGVKGADWLPLPRPPRNLTAAS